jgi:5-methyltetrahydrofolate--homocysteine methyltransferase
VGLIDLLRQSPQPLLWDGGIGTTLVAAGLRLDHEPPEAWLLSQPKAVQAVHAEFASAGADVVQTNSFGLLRLWLSNSSFAPAVDYRQLVRQSVALAQAGAGERPGRPARVVASLGPAAIAGLPIELLRDRAGQLAGWFAESGVEALHLETCYDPLELRALIGGIRAATPELPLLVSITVSVGQSGLETPLGVPLGRLLQELSAQRPDAVGLNCSLPARRLGVAVEALVAWRRRLAGRPADQLPLLFQPQVDQSAPDCKRPATIETAERFAGDLLALVGLVEDGAVAIGGCCGCRGSHLAAVRRLLNGS